MGSAGIWNGARRVLPAGGQAPSSAVLLLHGLGSNADDLIDLAPLLGERLPQTAFVSPNAPFPCDMGPMGYQWFSLQSWTPQLLWEGVQIAAPVLEQMIADVRAEFGLPAARVALLGFSQGTMMALHVAPRLKDKIAGVVGFSGALIGPEYLAAQTVSRPPVLLVHGQADPVVPYAALALANSALSACGFAVETETRPLLQHSIDQAGLDRAGDFLFNHFDI